MVIIPDTYNYVSVFLTLRCNYTCSYCVNEKSGNLKRKRKELNFTDWKKALNSLEMVDNIPLTISGGEPTMHKDFYELVNVLRHPIDLLTNLTFDVVEFTHKLSPYKFFNSINKAYKPIRVSFHPEFMDVQKTIAKLLILQDTGFNVGLFSINHPHNIETNLELAEECRKNMVYFFIKDFLGIHDGHLFGYYKYKDGLNRKINSKVLCKTKELLIGPDGKAFRCHRDLYADENSIGSLLDDNFKIEDKFRGCNKYGFCNNCDVKSKANRFLQMGECSVEIKIE